MFDENLDFWFKIENVFSVILQEWEYTQDSCMDKYKMPLIGNFHELKCQKKATVYQFIK